MPTGPSSPPAHAPDIPAGPAVLAYANPVVFFEGSFHHRTWESAVAALAYVAGAAAAVTFATNVFATRPGQGFPQPVRLALAVAAAGSLAAALTTAWRMAAGRRERVRVTEHGVERGRRVWAWDRVGWVGAVRHGAGVRLEFEVRRGAVGYTRLLPTVPPLTRDQYDALAARLRPFLASDFPHVTVVAEPRDPAAG